MLSLKLNLCCKKQVLKALNHFVVEHQISQKHPIFLTLSQPPQLLYETALIDIYRIEDVFKQLLILLEIVAVALGEQLNCFFAEGGED